jgi:hypothetical protein
MALYDTHAVTSADKYRVPAIYYYILYYFLHGKGVNRKGEGRYRDCRPDAGHNLSLDFLTIIIIIVLDTVYQHPNTVLYRQLCNLLGITASKN